MKKDALNRDLDKAKSLEKGVGGGGEGPGFLGAVRQIVAKVSPRQNSQYENKKQRDSGGRY